MTSKNQLRKRAFYMGAGMFSVTFGGLVFGGIMVSANFLIYIKNGYHWPLAQASEVIGSVYLIGAFWGWLMWRLFFGRDVGR